MQYKLQKTVLNAFYSIRWVLFLHFLLLSIASVGQVDIISVESMYNGTGGLSGDVISVHETNNRFENDALTMSGNGDMRTSLPSTGYIGASGTWNVMLNANNETFQISDINTTGYSSIALSFGFKQGAGSASSADFAVEVSSDGTTWSPLTLTFVGNTNWYLNTPSGVIPATTNLRIRFTNKHSTSWDFRIDDVKLTGNLPCNVPLVQATSLLCSTPGFQNINLQWTNGNGSGRIVKINTINSFTNPIDGTDPIANSTYAGAGEQVVYNGSNSSVNISGLEPCREYWFRVYEYNCSGTSILFNTATSVGNPINISTSSIPPSNMILASENFEAGSTWSYTQTCVSYGSGGSNGSCVVGIQPSPFGYLNSKALVKSHSVNNGSSEKGTETTFDFNLINIPASSTNISFSFRLASLNASGSPTSATIGDGHDSQDFFQLQMQLNSTGGYSTSFTQKGSGDQLYDYLPEKNISPLWNQNVTYSTPTNDYTFFTIAIPDGTTQVDIRYVLRNNRTGENWCIDEMKLSADVPAVSTLPSLFSITGNTSFCSGSTGTLIGLNGSQIGVSYQLFLNGVTVGSPVAGTGLPIDFGYHSSAGTYTVVASNTSFQYCKSDMLNPLVVTFLPSPTVTGVLTTPSACGTDNGTINITASGGVAPYSYSIDNGATWQTGNTFTGLAAGTYIVKVKGANTCESATATATITLSGSSLTSTVVQTDVKCYGDNTGSATVTGIGGSGILNYTWNTAPVQTGQTASNLSAGTYVCTITDAALCSIDVTVVITQPSSALSGGVVNQTNVGCYGGNTASVEVSGSGGTPPYSYSWNTIPVQIGPVANNLIAGTYTCTILDFNNCPKLVNVTILEPASILDATTSFSNVTCNGGNNGYASVTASGGTPLYSYEWNTIPPQYSSTATNLIAGTYTCTITDANSCSINKTVIVGQPAIALTGGLVSTPALICDGASNGTATVNASGGTPGYSYSWNTTPVQTTATSINLAGGSYICTITDLSLCTYDVLVDILSYPPPTTSNAGGIQNVCGLSTTLSANTPTTGTGVWSQVSGPASVLFGNPSSPTSTVSSTLAGTYVLQWTITNQPACPSSSSQVTIVFGPAVTASASSNSPVCTGNSLSLSCSISGATYSWSGPNSYTSNAQNPSISIAQLIHAGDYTVVVTGIPGGCPSTSATTHVDVYESAVAPQLLASSVISLCSDDNGAIILTATGGSGNTLEWFDDFCGGNLIGTGNNLSLPSPLVTTTYYARWNSAFCGNSSCQSVTVVVSDPPSQAIAGTDKNVCGLITSMSAVAPTVGTGQWSQVSGPASVVFGNASSNTSSVTATVIGTYVLRWTVTNMAQCPPSVDDVTVIFGNSVSVVASCNGPVCIGNTIRLYSSIDGATYSWTGPGAFTSNVQNPEIPNAQIPNMGVYFVTVSDIPGGCPDAMDDVAVVVTPKPLTAAINNNVSGVEDICNNQTSPYTIDPPTPGSVYTWSLSGGGTILPTASSNLINVQWAVVGGPYVLSVQETTTEGCTGDPVTLLVTVNVLSSPLVSIAASQNPACTGSTVTFTATPQYGGLNPVCKWYVNGIGPVVTDFTFSYVPAPNDEVQCKLTSSSPCAVGNPASSNKIVMSVAGTVAAGITIASPVQSLCIGDGATVKAVLTNGGNAPDIKWYKNGLLVPGESDTVFNFIPANGDKVYAELISNSACAIPAQASSTELMFIVSNALPLTVSISQDAVLCYGLPVTIKASTINQGSTPIYEWSQNGIPVPGVSGNSITKTFAEGDKVTLKVSSSLSCSTGSPATSNEITVTMPTQVSVVSVDTVSADCGEQNGSIEINANGGTGSFVYSIQAIENWRSSNHFDSIAPNTSYYVKAKDQNGCIGDYGIVTISALPGPLVNAVGPALVCEGSSLDMQASSSTLGLTYEWTSPAGMLFNGDLMNLNPVQLSDTGIYVVKGSAPSGCWDTSQFKVIVKPKPMVDFALPSPVCLGVSYTLDAGAGFATYQWQDGSIGQTFSAASAGDYFVEVTDLDGCKGGDTLQIVPCGSFYFPNAFTPNGDWKNDYFVPVTGGLNPKGFRLTIFNSWGQILFESSDPTTGWDGSMAGGQAPLGIYTYVCTYSLPDPDNISVYMEPETKRGLVLLLR